NRVFFFFNQFLHDGRRRYHIFIDDGNDCTCTNNIPITYMNEHFILPPSMNFNEIGYDLLMIPFLTWIISAFCKVSWRSEEHTSELQSRFDLVCRLLLEKKKHIYK